jgi:hypothetical protein
MEKDLEKTLLKRYEEAKALEKKKKKSKKSNHEGVLIGALSVSFYTLFMFSCSFPPSQTHHVIFEEIGKMAGALSYVHVVIPVNISRLSMAVQHFCEKVMSLQKGYDQGWARWKNHYKKLIRFNSTSIRYR